MVNVSPLFDDRPPARKEDSPHSLSAGSAASSWQAPAHTARPPSNRIQYEIVQMQIPDGTCSLAYPGPLGGATTEREPPSSGGPRSEHLAARPREQEIERVDATSILLRNLPARCTIADLLHLIGSTTFQGTFEYLYLPMHPNGRQNLGYAFVQFANARQALLFDCAVTGTCVPGRQSAKEITTSRARARLSATQVLARVQASRDVQVLQTRWGPVLVPSTAQPQPISL